MMLSSNLLHHTSASNCETSPLIIYADTLSLPNEQKELSRIKLTFKGEQLHNRLIFNPSDQIQTLKVLNSYQGISSLHKATKTVANSRQYSRNYAIEGQNSCKTKIDKNRIKIDGQEAVRLSLTSFQEQLRTLGPSRRAMTARGNDQVTSFKLQGIEYAGINQKNKFHDPADRKMKNALSHTRNALKMCEQSNLNEFNRILSKMNLEQNKQPDQYQVLALKKIPKKRRILVKPASPCKKVQTKSLGVKEHPTMNIINLIPATIIPEKVKCDYIYTRHFLKNGQTAIRSASKKQQNSLTENQLVKELMEIKLQIANRNRAQLRLQQKQLFTKYTTTFIEEKLTMRKSLMRSYTFKKRAFRAQHPRCDDFDVDGWNSIQADHMVS